MAPCIIAGPTCDSVDVLYEKNPYPLPVSLAIGDKVLIEATGAYTATYSSVGFNGYPPLRQYVICSAALAGKPDSRNRAEYGEIVWDALALIGEKRVIWSGQPELDVGVFKKTKSAKKGPTRTAEVPADAAVPACG